MAAPLGNTNATKGKLFGDALRKALVQDDFTRLRDGIDKLLDEAGKGERWALEMVRDTMDGKPAQAITGADGGALEIGIVERVIKDAVQK